MMHSPIIVLFFLPSSCLEKSSSALAEELPLGLEHGRIDLAALVDDVNGGASSVGEVDDFLGAHVPPYLDALGLQLGDVYVNYHMHTTTICKRGSPYANVPEYTGKIVYIVPKSC
jgi:hypothetical protein